MLLAALSLLTSEAQAYSFFMAGYGPTISTNVLSLQFTTRKWFNYEQLRASCWCWFTV